MEAALSDAGVDPSQIDYIEAHGTGTAVGDPIELNAMSAVYGPSRKADDPLLIGSVKTNVGHLESAAGVAGLIKAALTVKLGLIPKHLHFQNPNPAFDWERWPLQVTTDTMEWPDRGKRPRLAGVNSFGISGTNAHIVVEEYVGDWRIKWPEPSCPRPGPIRGGCPAGCFDRSAAAAGRDSLHAIPASCLCRASLKAPSASSRSGI